MCSMPIQCAKATTDCTHLLHPKLRARYILCSFVSLRFVWARSVSFGFVSVSFRFRLVSDSVRFVSFRLVSFCRHSLLYIIGAVRQ